MRQFILATIFVALAIKPSAAATPCDPALMYQTVKIAVLQKEPHSEAEFASIMSSLGLTQDQHVWKCETAEGTMLTVFLGAKRWVTIDYTPNKAERVPDAILSILSTQGQAEILGPSAVRFHLLSNQAEIAALGAAAAIDEYVTVSLAGAIHQDTQCTVKFRARTPLSK